jgi:hypothetical protein
VENVPQALKLEAAHYFGSLEKAIGTLKKQRNRLPGWNRRKIMTVLSEIHRGQRKFGLRASATQISGTGKCRPKPILEAGVRLCMLPESTQICILCITDGGN